MNSSEWKQFWNQTDGIGLCRVSLDGEILACSRYMGAMLGRDPNVLEGMNVDEVCAVEDRGHFKRAVDTLMENKEHSIRTEQRFRLPNGKRIWCQASSVLILQNGEPVYILKAIYEIPSGEQLSAMGEISQRLARQEELVQSLMKAIENKPVINVSGGGNSSSSSNSVTLIIVFAIALALLVIGFIVMNSGGAVKVKHGESELQMQHR